MTTDQEDNSYYSIHSAEVHCDGCGSFVFDLPKPMSYPEFCDAYELDHKCPRCNNTGCYIYESPLSASAPTQKPYLSKNHTKGKTNNKRDGNKQDNSIKKIINEEKADWQLEEHIKKDLENILHYVSNHEPIKFYVANESLNQIVCGYIGIEHEIDDDGYPTEETHQKLRYSVPLLDAIPLEGIKYNNGLSTDKKYKLKFRTNTGEVFTTLPNTIEDTMYELRGRNLVAKKALAEDALRGIVNSMEIKGMIEVTNNIEEPGFYPDPDNENKITCYGLTFKDPTIEEIQECADLISEIMQRYERKDSYGNINDRKIFAVTVLKWAISAPFGWVMKTRYNKWIPWLHLGGWHQTSKNTLARFGLALWRVHNKSVYGFTSANTEYRLGHVLSRSTLPININEVNNLTHPKYIGLVEMIKNLVDERNARGKQQKKNYTLIPSLSTAIITGNGVPPKDGGYRTKCRTIVFTYKDEIDRESKEAKDFRDWLNDKIHLLGTLGDFTANYIMNNPDLLKNKEWDGIGTEVLKAFYAKAGLDTPTWINLLVEHEESVQTQDEAVQMLQGYFIDLINDTCNRYRPPKVTSDYDIEDSFNSDYTTMSLTQRLVECCKRYLIPFITYRPDKNIFYITPAIIQDLQKKRLGDLVGSHKGLADLLGFKHGNAKMNGGQSKVIIVSREEMKNLLQPEIEVVEKSNDQDAEDAEGVESDDQSAAPPQLTKTSNKKK